VNVSNSLASLSFIALLPLLVGGCEGTGAVAQEPKREVELRPGVEKQETEFRVGVEKRTSRAAVLIPQPEYDMVLMEAVATAAGSGVYEIGVIPGSASCPQGSALIDIYMDDEDHNNNNSAWGWHGAIITGSNTRFRFCKVDGTAFKPLQTPCNDCTTDHYAVLKLGVQCPPGSSQFYRMFDNEDDDNNNSHSGNIYPNWQGRNTGLYFCIFRSGWQTMSDFPNIGIQYGVFAASGFSRAISVGSMHTDDEDDDNINRLDVASYLHSDVVRIVFGAENTTLRTVRVR
jgi:hypothetical protein